MSARIAIALLALLTAGCGAARAQVSVPHGVPVPAGVAGPTISNIECNSFTPSGFTVEWDTNEAATTQAFRGSDGGPYTDGNTTLKDTPADGEGLLHHIAAFTGLANSTTYYVIGQSVNVAGGTSNSSQVECTTTAADVTAPVISNITLTGTTSSTLTFSFDVSDANSPIETRACWGAPTGPPYDNCSSWSSGATAATFTPLNAETLYEGVIQARDPALNTATSDEQSGTTSASGGALMPDVGLLATGDSNVARAVILPAHWTLTQTLYSVTLGATGLVGNGSSCTATVATDPTTGDGKMYVGGTVTTAGMTDSNGNQTKKVISALTSTTVTFACTFNGTTGSGTLKSDIWPEMVTGEERAEPNSIFGGTVVHKLADETTAGSSPQCRPYYRGTPWMTQTQEYVLLHCGGSGMAVINTATNAGQCVGFTSGGTTQPRNSRNPATPYKVYYISGASILSKTITGGTCSSATTVKNFSATYNRIHFTPGSRLGLSATGDELIAVVGCLTAGGSACPNGGAFEVFVFNLTTLASGPAYSIPSSSPNIDELHFWPSTERMIVNFSSSCTGACDTETEGGIIWIEADGTFGGHLSTTNKHFIVGTDEDGDDFWARSESGVGWVIQDLDTLVDRTPFSSANAAPGGGACGNMTFQAAIEGHWFVLAITQEGTATPEAFLSAAWSTSWCRGANELWIGKTKGTIDGTHNALRLRHRWTSQAETDGTGSNYNHSPHVSFSMLTPAQAAAGDVPSCVIINEDSRLSTGNGTTQTVLSTLMIPLRAGGCNQ